MSKAVQYSVEAMQFVVNGRSKTPISMSGQSVLDRVMAAKHTITGSDLAKSVCKATTEEVLGPKKKHLDYLLQCTNTEHINIPDLADTLIQRASMTSWVNVFKSLVTCHHLMVYGNERFIRYLATRTVIFNLEEFADKTGDQGYAMSTYVRKYSKYLNQKALSYRNMAFDFCRVKRGKEDGVLRTMTTEKLLKALPHLQNHLDALLDFEVASSVLNNGVINSAFMLLFKDCIRLFACYNDGIINLLDKYFDMSKKDCKTALDLYQKFLIRMDHVSEFLKVAEQVGIDKGEIPDLAKAPSSLLEALEQHMQSLEGSKKSQWNKPHIVQTAVQAFGISLVGSADSEEKLKAIEDENDRLQALKQQPVQASPPPPPAVQPAIVATVAAPTLAANNPFATPAEPVPVAAPAPITQKQPSSAPSNDLIGLSANPGMSAVLQAQQRVQQQRAPPVWGAQNGFPNNNSIGANFESAFGPATSTIAPVPQQPAVVPGGDFGNILQPMNTVPDQQMPPQENLATTNPNDLDSTLSSLATNLNIKPTSSPIKTSHQWNKNAGPSVRTGGMQWQPKQVTTTTTWQQSQAPPYMEQSALPAQQPMGMNNMGVGMNMGMGMQQRPMGMQQPPMYGAPMAQPGYPYQRPPAPQQMQPADPFGPY